jgi:small subunit ribosomal protein S17
MTAAQGQYGGRKVREGTVVSDKMQKTVLVAVETNFRHRLYKKTVRRIRRLMAHDEAEDAQMGDRVRIVEASPISRRKRWRLVEVLTRAELPEVAPESIDLDLIGEVKREEEEPEAAAAASTDGAKDEAIVAEPEAISSPEAEAVEADDIEIEEAVAEPGDEEIVETSTDLEGTEPVEDTAALPEDDESGDEPDVVESATGEEATEMPTGEASDDEEEKPA